MNNKINLLLFGVPIPYHSKRPKVFMYPKLFGQDSLPLWKEMFNNPEVLYEIRSVTVSDAWEFVITRFLLEATKSGIDPFKNIYREKNTPLLNSMLVSRRKIVHTLDRIKLFAPIKIEKVRRKIYKRTDGFRFKSAGFYKVKGKIDYIDYILNRKVRFIRDGRGGFIKRLSPTIKVKIDAFDKTISYQFVVDEHPYVKLLKIDKDILDVVSKQQYDYAILNSWLSVVRRTRFKTIGNAFTLF